MSRIHRRRRMRRLSGDDVLTEPPGGGMAMRRREFIAALGGVAAWQVKVPGWPSWERVVLVRRINVFGN